MFQTALQKLCCDHASNLDKNKTLREAGAEGHLDCVKLLLFVGADVNSKDEDGVNAVMNAVEAGHTECCKELVEAGANVNQQDIKGRTVLYRGVLSSKNNRDCLNILMEAGADVNIGTHDDGGTALMKVAYLGNFEAVELLLTAGADVNHTDKNRFTAITNTIHNGHSKCLELLVLAGASVNKRYQHRQTPLILATKGGRRSCVEVLLLAGADVNTTDESGKNNLDYAKELGFRHCAYLLEHIRTIDDAFLRAAAGGHEKYFPLLLAAGANVNAVSSDGNSAFVLTVMNKHYSAMLSLAKSGADVNAKTEYHEPVIIYAVDDKYPEALVRLGADVNVVNWGHNNTVLMLAARNGWKSCIVTLLGAGAHVNKYNNSVIQPRNAVQQYLLHARKPNPRIIRLFHAAGETVDGLALEESDSSPEETPTCHSLISICRLYIRNHLLRIDPHLNLFIRVPQLDLPLSLNDYLLFNMSLKEDELQEKD